jgi:hypothetical protein
MIWRAPFCDELGELLPKYRPEPAQASFLEPEAADDAASRGAIPVPKGPVEVW